ncbi:MAG: hypothetical protein KJO64_07860 [Bacteroidia bacterium]|nr:hypothetical protein [Bacteroidia bacterium]NNC85267.1 hypothetical protein [Bacteroidia bacterium]
MKNKLKLFSLLLVIGLVSSTVLTSCDDDDDPSDGTFRVVANVHIDGQAVDLNDMKYVNASGNTYSVVRFKAALSKMRVNKSGVGDLMIDSEHLVDITDPASMTIYEGTIAGGDYESVTFIFGLDSTMNIRGAYPNPPFSNFEWPMMLGADVGYHYMQLDGFYDGSSGMDPYNTHAGPTQGVHYHSEYTFPVQFEIDGGTTTATIDINLNNFYNGPNAWDFSVVPTAIMPLPAWQVSLRENAEDVFSVTVN